MHLDSYVEMIKARAGCQTTDRKEHISLTTAENMAIETEMAMVGSWETKRNFFVNMWHKKLQRESRLQDKYLGEGLMVVSQDFASDSSSGSLSKEVRSRQTSGNSGFGKTGLTNALKENVSMLEELKESFFFLSKFSIAIAENKNGALRIEDEEDCMEQHRSLQHLEQIQESNLAYADYMAIIKAIIEAGDFTESQVEEWAGQLKTRCDIIFQKVPAKAVERMKTHTRD